MNQADTTEKGFFGALFDLSFKSYVVPKLLKLIFILVIIFSGLGGLVEIAIAFKLNAAAGVFTLLIGAPLEFFFSVILWRVIIEFIMSWFNAVKSLAAISESVAVIAGGEPNTSGLSGPSWPDGGPRSIPDSGFHAAPASAPAPVRAPAPTTYPPQPQRCANCSVELKPGDRFCESCGTPA
jgi:hypothetical protein